MFCRPLSWSKVTFYHQSFTAHFLVLADQELTKKIHGHIKHTIPHTNWLSLLLTLTLSICLPMTVGLSSTLWCSLFLWVRLPKMECPSQSERVKLMQGRMWSVSKRLWIYESTQAVFMCCLSMLMSEYLWFLCFFSISIVSVSVFQSVMKDKWTVDGSLMWYIPHSSLFLRERYCSPEEWY